MDEGGALKSQSQGGVNVRWFDKVGLNKFLAKCTYSICINLERTDEAPILVFLGGRI